MKKLVITCIICIASSAISYAQQPNDFRLINPQINNTDVLIDIQRTLNSINRNLNDINVKMQGQGQGNIRPQQMMPTPMPTQRATPPRDAGPTWTYDPTTNSYFRYVPTRTSSPSPYYRSTPTPTPNPQGYYPTPRSPVVTEGAICPT